MSAHENVVPLAAPMIFGCTAPSDAQGSPVLCHAALDDIDVDEMRVRNSPDERDIAALADSIKANGLLHPLLVQTQPETGRFRLIAGHRRLAAIRRLNATAVPVFVMDPRNELHRLSIQVVENLQRRALSPSDRRTAYLRLRELAGGSTLKASTMLGIHTASFRRVVREGDLTEARSVGRLSLGQTLKSLDRWSEAASRLSSEKQHQLLDRAMALVSSLEAALHGRGSGLADGATAVDADDEMPMETLRVAF